MIDLQSVRLDIKVCSFVNLKFINLKPVTVVHGSWCHMVLHTHSTYFRVLLDAVRILHLLAGLCSKPIVVIGSVRCLIFRNPRCDGSARERVIVKITIRQLH